MVRKIKNNKKKMFNEYKDFNANFVIDEDTQNKINKIKGVIHSIPKNSKIFQCIHPNQHECSGKIGINAHSIQNTRIVKKLSKDNHVYMINQPLDKFGFEFKLIGRNDATTFTGFCKEHDTEVFAPIEKDSFYQGTDEQHFLYAYRAFARSFHKKLEQIKGVKYSHLALVENTQNDKLDERANIVKNDVVIYKEKFDKAIIEKKYDILETRSIKLNKNVEFAVNSFFQMMNYKDTVINDFNDITKPIKPLMLNVFPEQDESYILISCFKEDYEAYKVFFEDIKNMNKEQLFLTLNNLIPKYCENIIIAPEFFKNWNGNAKFDYLKKYEISSYAEVLNWKIDLKEKCKYNLFDGI